METRRSVKWQVVRMLAGLAATTVGGFTLGLWAAPGGAGTPLVQAASPPVNACGCYRDSTGACFCGKKGKGKCDCPGDCEPKGCEEKRAKEMEKEVEAESKRARDAERKQHEEAEEKRKKAEAAANEEAAAAEGGGGADDGAEQAEERAADAKAKKPKARERDKKGSRTGSKTSE